MVGSYKLYRVVELWLEVIELWLIVIRPWCTLAYLTSK